MFLRQDFFFYKKIMSLLKVNPVRGPKRKTTLLLYVRGGKNMPLLNVFFFTFLKDSITLLLKVKKRPL